jgi:hypothetical protein
MSAAPAPLRGAVLRQRLDNRSFYNNRSFYTRDPLAGQAGFGGFSKIGCRHEGHFAPLRRSVRDDQALHSPVVAAGEAA